MTYVAPAALPFTVLHLAEDGADLKAPAGAEPLTVCGLVMARADLWVPLDARPTDQVCRACRGLPETPPRQLALTPWGSPADDAQSNARSNARSRG